MKTTKRINTKEEKKIENFVNEVATKYFKGLGLSGSQADYLKSLLAMLYKRGYRDGRKDGYDSPLRLIKEISTSSPVSSSISTDKAI